MSQELFRKASQWFLAFVCLGWGISTAVTYMFGPLGVISLFFSAIVIGVIAGTIMFWLLRQVPSLLKVTRNQFLAQLEEEAKPKSMATQFMRDPGAFERVLRSVRRRS